MVGEVNERALAVIGPRPRVQVWPIASETPILAEAGGEPPHPEDSFNLRLYPQAGRDSVAGRLEVLKEVC